ncbi:MAG TPA: VOC family protein [Nocardioidaceae bacterium]|nr:VOC family protein [Nocardioidaceae bacterium]
MSIPETDREPLTGQQIVDSGLDGWRKVLNHLVVRFATGDFSTGAALVGRIAEVADEADHHPDVDLRYPHLTVSLVSHDVSAVTARDVRLAQRISELAAEAGVRPTNHAPDVLEFALDTADHTRLKPFYAALLGYTPNSQYDVDLRDKADRTPNLWFQSSDSEAPDRQRWHLDVSVPHDVAEARLQAVLDAGGTLVDDGRAPAFWVVADPDGNRSCICTWQARD